MELKVTRIEGPKFNNCGTKDWFLVSTNYGDDEVEDAILGLIGGKIIDTYGSSIYDQDYDEEYRAILAAMEATK